MKPYFFALLALAISGCASSSNDRVQPSAGYCGIEELRIFAKGME